MAETSGAINEKEISGMEVETGGDKTARTDKAPGTADTPVADKTRAQTEVTRDQRAEIGMETGEMRAEVARMIEVVIAGEMKTAVVTGTEIETGIGIVTETGIVHETETVTEGETEIEGEEMGMDGIGIMVAGIKIEIDEGNPNGTPQKKVKEAQEMSSPLILPVPVRSSRSQRMMRAMGVLIISRGQVEKIRVVLLLHQVNSPPHHHPVELLSLPDLT